MSISEKDIDSFSRELEMVKFYRENPVIAAEDLLRVVLPVPQRKILEDMWFKNFVLVTAGRGSGKCTTGCTLINTSQGMLRIDEMGSKLNPLSDIDLTIHGLHGQEKATKWYYDGVQETNNYTTSRGYSVKVTDKHKLITVDSNCELQWGLPSSINVGDYLVIDRKVDLWSSTDHCTQDEALLMGLLVGDGCFRGNKYLLGFTSGDQEVRDTYSDLGKSIFGYSPGLVEVEGKCPNLNYYTKSVWSHLTKLGLVNDTLSGDKVIPSSVMKSGKNIVSYFLKGLFEADGGCESNNQVTYCTKSVELARQVHTLLLNFGIVCRLRTKQVKYLGELRDYEVINITGGSVDLFKRHIGFVSYRKNKTLSSFPTVIRNSNVDTVPFLEGTFYKMWDRTRGVLSCEERDLYKKYKNGYYNPTYPSLIKCIRLYPFNDELKEKLIKIVEKNYFYDKVVSKESGLSEVYDLVVPGTNSFVGNGFINHNTFLTSVFACLWAMLYPGQKIGLLAPSFRQARMMFAEVEARWNGAPLLQEATAKRPTSASDKCYLQFRKSGFTAGSVIEAIPLGTGEKIRGARYYVILADEFAQIPEVIYNTVILPMGATVADPMANVKRISQERELIRTGRATQEDFTKKSDNKIIMTSSAFYQFNHMYTTKVMYEDSIRKGNTQYAVHTVSYRDMPEGFLSEENLKQGRLKLSKQQFSMEYEAIWEADSAGVFKASLIDKCRTSSTNSIALSGTPGAEYILGVDPARASDAFALCLIEAGPVNKVVAAWEYYQNVFPKMAQTIMDICDTYNVIAVHMDAGAGGGGLAMKDLLYEQERWGASRIVDVNDDEYKNSNGRHILHMFNPSPKSNAEAVFSSLNLMERDALTFPQPPQPRGTDNQSFKDLEKSEEMFETVSEMIRQLMLIEVSESKSGVAHFDVPSGGGHALQKKDLYTAFILASKKAYDLMVGDTTSTGILEIGLVTTRQPFQLPEKNKVSSSIEVSQVPLNSWPFKNKFKPGL